MNSCSSHKTADSQLMQVLKLISDQTRLKVLTVLESGGQHSVSDCRCHVPGTSQSLLSHHIADLRRAGLVESVKEGLRVNYSLTSKGQKLMKIINKLKEDYPMSGCKCENCTCQNCQC